MYYFNSDISPKPILFSGWQTLELFRNVKAIDLEAAIGTERGFNYLHPV